MDLSHKNILDTYRDYKNSSYILNNFTSPEWLSIYPPNRSNPFAEINKGDTLGIQVVDRDNDYNINELGFRGDINYDSEIIALGCSYTFGVGVPEDGLWTNILSNKINKDIINLGVGGYTIKKICELAIKYVSQNKKPKTIIALFPSFFRGMLIEDINFYSSSRNTSPKENKKIRTQLSFESELYYDKGQDSLFFINTDGPKFFKSKDKVTRYMENVLSPHQLISDAIDAISILQSFCYSHGIDLYWSTWDRKTSILLDTLMRIPNFKLKNYIKFYENSFCKLDHNSNLVDHPSWNIGSDICVDLSNNILKEWPSHPGIHYHYHLAEVFEHLFTNNAEHDILL